jgi:hypothetical protein
MAPLRQTLREYFGGHPMQELERIGFWVAIFCAFVATGLALNGELW